MRLVQGQMGTVVADHATRPHGRDHRPGSSGSQARLRCHDADEKDRHRCDRSGPAFKQSEAFSFQVYTEDQAETDRLWNAIVDNGGEESACGWCKDKWGLSWQITPRALTDGMADPDPAVNKRVFDAMMKMRKIDVAAIEAARRG